MSFESASNEYERQLPPGSNDPDLDTTCLLCNGNKVVDESECCGAETRNLGVTGEPVCTACNSPCEKSKCQHCNGTGEEPIS